MKATDSEENVKKLIEDIRHFLKNEHIPSVVAAEIPGSWEAISGSNLQRTVLNRGIN